MYVINLDIKNSESTKLPGLHTKNVLMCLTSLHGHCQCALCAYMLMCQPTLHAYVLMCQPALRAYVLMCKCAILNKVNSYITQIC